MSRPKLAMFDLDNTLINGDSDVSWAQFLIEEGILDRAQYERRNLWFAERYHSGTLDIHEFLEFQLAPLAAHPRERLDAWHAAFMERKVRPMIHRGTRELIDSHAGGLRALVTATNRFITEPIARELRIENLIATDIEEVDGCFTGRPRGKPCFREGKIDNVNAWLASLGAALADFESWFYSDSLNDVPLLERVTHPVAVDPDPVLAGIARERGWPVLSLRDPKPQAHP